MPSGGTRWVESLCIACLLGFLPIESVEARSESRWGSKLSTPDFTRAVERINAAAREQEPFASLKGQVDLRARGVSWKPIVILPGADTCEVDQENITMREFTYPAFLSYSCFARYNSSDKALNGYEALVKLLSEATQWKVVSQVSKYLNQVSLCPPRDGYDSCPVNDPKYKVDVRYTITLSNANLVSLTCLGRLPHPIASAAHGSLVIGSGEGIVFALRQAVTAASEDAPFASITLGSLQEGKAWKAAVVLPEAASCTIRMMSSSEQPFARPVYACQWQFSDRSQAQASYQTLREAIKRSGDWMVRWEKENENRKNAVFHTNNSLGADLSIDLARESTIILFLTPARYTTGSEPLPIIPKQ